VATPGALELLASNSISPLSLLQRHCSGDWGDLSTEDVRANDTAIQDGSRLLSAYVLPDGSKVYVITEWNRSYTTILRADEY